MKFFIERIKNRKLEIALTIGGFALIAIGLLSEPNNLLVIGAGAALLSIAYISNGVKTDNEKEQLIERLNSRRDEVNLEIGELRGQRKLLEAQSRKSPKKRKH